ncbi:MAG: ankyrin repeat domain-containing protein [Verrucomicrobia bacterium]|nr:ankyrin repeat domain-containing protein [Verrucomicrobiota bacterium]MBI3867609.1 ankyrin repeat domain-containing protein [Verrucomicrobiota bacterium]
MATVSRGLPEKPHLDVPKREARELLKEWRAGSPAALDRIRQRHPGFRDADAAAISTARFLLSDAQLVLAREYGFSNWAQLKQRIDANTVTGLLLEAIQNDDRETVARLLRANPTLLHVPLWSGNWGPPMSHAANLGRLEIIKAVAALGARDHQHAFDRAVLQGKLESARWLHEQGAKLAPGIVMGACECLNPAGLGFLADLGAPFTDDKGNRLAPLAMVLETYGRNPTGKRAVLEILARQGYILPDKPLMAFHRGDLERLKDFLRRDPGLTERRFGSIEIYPPELGCAKDGRSGMHWTPIDGTTLLHLAIDFDEEEVFELLLAHGADVNARANVDADGFGGHTPLFNAVVSHGSRQGSMARRLVERGASKTVRASLRKFLDWCETPRWHEAREATPAEWGWTFPEKSWVNAEAMRVAEGE